MSAKFTSTEAIMRAEKLMNDGFTFDQILAMLKVKGDKLNAEIEAKRAEIADRETEVAALRDVYRHIQGIIRTSSESVSAQAYTVTNKQPATTVEVPAQAEWPQPFVADVPAAITQTELIENAAEVLAPVAANKTRVGIPDGVYTVVMANERRTIKLRKHWDEAEAAKGTQVAYYLSGSNNESDYTGFAFVTGTRVAVWKKFRNGSALLQSALAFLLQGDNYESAGKLYAMESGNCWHCNRLLTTPESIALGIGPVCAKKLGIS